MYWVRRIGFQPGRMHLLEDAALMVHDGLAELGRAVSWDHGDKQILIGAQVASPAELASIPDGSIVWNLEQAGIAQHFHDDYLRLLRRCEVWDWNEVNIQRLRSLYGIEAKYLPCAYVPALIRAPYPAPSIQPCDLLFIGGLNDFRWPTIVQLRDAGFKVHCAISSYGDEKARLYAQCLAVLNIHAHPTYVMESLRLTSTMAHRVPVLCQVETDTAVDPDLLPGVFATPLSRIVESARALCDARGHLLAHYAREGHRVATARRMSDCLARVL